MTHRFYKDGGGWYIDLPHLIEAGIFSKGNLAMVAGADSLLETMAPEGEIILKFEKTSFEGADTEIEFQQLEMDEELLEEIGHPVQMGGDYLCTKLFGEPCSHKLWLCQVCSFLFDGEFPQNIYIKKEKYV